jgi:SOS-response transcriptional repressor LexA
MSARGLTREMRWCLLVIQELTDCAGGICPSYAEIQRELCASSRACVFRLVSCLEQRGYLARLPGRSRSLAILSRIEMPEEVEFVGAFEDAALAAQLGACAP